MYCQACRVQFTGVASAGRCPYCGLAAAPEALPAARPGVPARARAAPAAVAAASGDDSTRTEVPRGALWAPGAVVAGKYEVLSCLGAGGFGTVYKVRHLVRKKHYALKTPHPEFAASQAFRRRFEREIEAMERFVHPDAVMIRDSGITEEGCPYYTMDFIDGESLKTVLRREERLHLPRALEIVRRVLRVLEVAHAHGIIHRDIKPDNILLARVGGREAVKVLDFGVAKLLDLVGGTSGGTGGERVGTPKYMSPELITGETVDARSDLFSLGIVFYEVITGKHPFELVPDPIRVTAAILNREPAPPRDLAPDLPRSVNDLVLRLLRKKKRERPASAAAVLEEMEDLGEEVASRNGAAERPRLLDGVKREHAMPVVLLIDTAAGERRCFLNFDEKVSFGRSNRGGERVSNGLILRCLPCRSQALDADNWQKNLSISHVAGTIHPDGQALVIEAAAGAKHGLGIGGLRSQRQARIQADRFHLSLGDRALEIDGHRMLRGSERPEFDLSFLARGRPPRLEAPVLTGYSNPAALIDCVRLLRAGNWPLHEYYLVYRILRLGASASAALRLRGKGLEGLHAAVVYEEGEAFLVPLEGKVRVSGLKRQAAGAPEGSELAPLELVPLAPGMEVRLGECRLRVEAAAEPRFKTV